MSTTNMQRIAIDLGVLREAGRDLLWLLERGYGREYALRVVTDRYRLDRITSSILYRGIHTRSVAQRVKSKLVSPDYVRNRSLVVDGINVLGSITSMLEGGPVIICLDGLLRDVLELHGNLLKRSNINEAISLLVRAISYLSPSRVEVLLESQVSRSGEVAAALRRELRHMVPSCESFAYTTKQVDTELVRLGQITATSDSVVASKVGMIFDLPAFVFSSFYEDVQVIDLREVILGSDLF